ncbi:GNAT family N-acetyltransferase [Mucilaginibacter segetis]|uniref:GNAT family N-acetyltransferase n=1 Tax=Mucilaginibacter segetis TaxID=2793071 RepID=A0A934PRL5_9SPHI|nr:GNAT family N-acetyltransferase [Mucilaginibacter segetis]MBK0379504.1 GNAT family N-acetyltransferase [Mucilaginibacter segetis]
MTGLIVKHITLAEAQLVTGLFNKYRVFYKQPSDLQLAESFINERLSNNESVIFVALNINDPVGFVQLYPKYSSMRVTKNWILNDLYVDEPYRKKGIATYLIHTAMEYAKDHSAHFVQLETQNNNYNAQRLYQSLGFIKQQPDNEFIMYRKNVE